MYKIFILFLILLFSSYFVYSSSNEEKIQAAYSTMERDYKASLDILKQVIENVQNDTNQKTILFDAFMAQGTVYTYIRDFENAVKSFDECIKLNPKNYDSRFYRGQVLAKLNQIDKANEDWKVALEIKPNDPKVTEVVEYYKNKQSAK